jgi:hypothetical protein
MRLLLASLSLLFVLTNSAYSCTVTGQALSARQLVRLSDAIVLTHVETRTPMTAVGERAVVDHKCIRTIKGNACREGEALSITGYVWDKDELRADARVPRTAARSSADGPCVAMGYVADGWYLLFLKRTEGKYSPYWRALAPTNEQVSGLNDPWVEWVIHSAKRYEAQR